MYFIIETKTDKNGSAIVTPIPGYTDYDKAVSAFYFKCVYASDPDLSRVNLHAVSLIDHLNKQLMYNVFSHNIPEPEPEQAPEQDDAVEEQVDEYEEEQVEDEPIDEEPVEEEVEEEQFEDGGLDEQDDEVEEDAE